MNGLCYLGGGIIQKKFGLGNGAEQVITLERTVVRVYGYRNVKPKTVKRDSEYRRNSIANHTHY